MPIYVYECPECGREEEVEQGMDEERLIPMCQGGDPPCMTIMDRKFVPTGIRVEGGASPNRTSLD